MGNILTATEEGLSPHQIVDDIGPLGEAYSTLPPLLVGVGNEDPYLGRLPGILSFPKVTCQRKVWQKSPTSRIAIRRSGDWKGAQVKWISRPPWLGNHFHREIQNANEIK